MPRPTFILFDFRPGENPKRVEAEIVGERETTVRTSEPLQVILYVMVAGLSVRVRV